MQFFVWFLSHQGHLRWLRPRLWCFLRLHRSVEQSVPHPRRLVQCQPADETFQTVNAPHHPHTHHTCNICNQCNQVCGHEVTDKWRRICYDCLFSAIIINFVYETLCYWGCHWALNRLLCLCLYIKHFFDKTWMIMTCFFLIIPQLNRGSHCAVHLYSVRRGCSERHCQK